MPLGSTRGRLPGCQEVERGVFVILTTGSGLHWELDKKKNPNSRS